MASIPIFFAHSDNKFGFFFSLLGPVFSCPPSIKPFQNQEIMDGNKRQEFFFFLKGAFTSLSCMGCFIQTHHSSQLTLHNEQEERMRELMDKIFFFFWVLLKGHSSFTSRITDTIIMSSNIFGLKNHCHYPFSTIQFL